MRRCGPHDDQTNGPHAAGRPGRDGRPRGHRGGADGTWFGLGWDIVVAKDKSFGYFKEGTYQGMKTYMKRLPGGVNWVLLYNSSMEFEQQDLALVNNLVQEVRKLIEDTGNYPDTDLFNEYD